MPMIDARYALALLCKGRDAVVDSAESIDVHVEGVRVIRRITRIIFRKICAKLCYEHAAAHPLEITLAFI